MQRLLIKRRHGARYRKLKDRLDGLKAALTSIGDGLIITNAAGKVTFINEMAEKITGWSKDECAGQDVDTVFPIINLKTKRRVESPFKKVLEGQGATGLPKNTAIVTKSKEEIYVSANVSPVINQGKTTGVVVVFRDIRRLRLAEEAVLQKQKNMETVFNSSPIGMVIVDENCEIKQANTYVLQDLRLNSKEVVGHAFGDVINCVNSTLNPRGCGHSDKCKECRVCQLIKRAYEFGESQHGVEIMLTVYINRQQQNRWFNFYVVPFNETEFDYVLLLFPDITKQKEMQGNLVKWRDFYLRLFENFPIFIWRAGRDRKCDYVNNTWMSFTGRTLEQEIGNGWLEEIHPEDAAKFIKTYNLSFAAQISFEMEYRMRRYDGQYRWVYNIGKAYHDVDGQFAGYIGAVYDMTFHKQTLQELLKAKEAAEIASKAKSQFLANMSHEIRTPLNGMLGMIDLTINTKLTEPQRDNLIIAKECASSLLNVINDILDISKMEAGKLIITNRPFNLKNIVVKTVRMHASKAKQKGLSLEYILPADLPPVLNGDANRLEQILHNLISNAIKFTSMGKICVSLTRVTSIEAGVELEFAISDTGIGLSEADKKYLFKSFSQVDGSITRKHGGTGLGLAISKQLSELMGGRIWVESQKGQGSTFYFTLQIALGGIITEEESSYEGHAPERPLTILLAEDDRINQRVMELMLSEKGYMLTIANNGLEVLDCLKRSTFDLVLMDIQMPEMDGIEATRQIRKKENGTNEHIPIIAFTAYALEGDRERFLRAGMDGYLAKPVKMNELFLMIDKVLEKSRVNKILNELAAVSNVDKPSELTSMEKDFWRENILLNCQKLSKVYKKADYLLIENLAHNIKEAADDAGEQSIKRLGFRIELAARKEDKEEIAEVVHLLADEIEHLKKYRGGLS